MLARLGQWQAGQGAHLQLELRHVTGIKRVVTTVVRTRGHLVDHQWAEFFARARTGCQHEEFDAQNTHVVQLFGYIFCSLNCFMGKRFRHISFIGLGHGQDALAV
ncbi:hypothetical protein GALL_485970 [mine drainage metagenome]|uniref:Uncharacterized protein n=1 Tax=mine drainage metagenome TaxID=410659 RepID=A0A1J5PEJ9_9ZZZZ